MATRRERRIDRVHRHQERLRIIATPRTSSTGEKSRLTIEQVMDGVHRYQIGDHSLELIAAIGQLRTAVEFKTVVGALQTGHANARHAILLGLAASSHPSIDECLPVIAGCLLHPHPAVRRAAALALKVHGNRSSLVALRDLVNDPEEEVRQAVSASIIALEDRFPTAVPGQLSWVVLPPNWPSDIAVLRGMANSFNGSAREAFDRLRFIGSLKPLSAFRSARRLGSANYFVFLFERVVAAECPEWGNATYIINGTDDWQILLGRSKQELRQRFSNRVNRLIHVGEWKSRLASRIAIDW